jgi:hypothetical protein
LETLDWTACPGCEVHFKLSNLESPMTGLSDFKLLISPCLSPSAASLH